MPEGLAEDTSEVTEESAEEQAVLLKAKKRRERAETARRRWDARWLTNTLFMRGYHFARYNQSTNTVTFSTRSDAKIPINLAYAQKRSVKNQVVAFRPKWEVVVSSPSDLSIWNAKMSGELLDNVFQRQDVRGKIRGIVDHGLDHSVGFWKVEWDGDLRDGEGDIKITLVDPFDLYWDPRATSAETAEFVTLSLAKPIEVVKNNPHYENTDEIVADNKTAVSNYKKFRDETTNKSGARNKNTVILNETWLKERDDDGSVKMRIVTWTKNSVLRNEETEEDCFPFIPYRAHGDELNIYSESWASQIIPVNQVLDALESHIFEYNHLMARGRFVVDNNAGVNMVTNENGTFIQKNRGFECRQLEMHPLPSTVSNQVSNMIRYLEDIGGAHDISLGRLPTGIRSGLGIAELKQLDSTNQNLLVENMESFLKRVGERALKIYSEKLTTPMLVKRTGGSAEQYFWAVGQSGKGGMETGDSYKEGGKELPIAVIGDQDKVRVSIGSWLAYTKEAQKEEMWKWYKGGLIDQKTFLERVEFGDIEGIVERTANERKEGRGSLLPGQSPEASAKTGMKPAGEGPRPVPGAAPGGGTPGGAAASPPMKPAQPMPMGR